MLHNLFLNYEAIKLPVQNNNYINCIAILILFIACIATYGKRHSSFLDKLQTIQLRGIAILFIIIGHFWVHVSQIQSNIILGGEGVALFLILSGYGLTLSFRNKKPNLKKYLSRRIKRVMVPYWSTTILIMILDYFILNRFYSFNDIILTFIGININSSTQHIDYVRWYITMLIFWYIVFYISMSITNETKSIVVMFLCAAAVFPINYYITRWSWYQIFAFPVGCLIGGSFRDLKMFFQKYQRVFFIISLMLVFLIILYKIFLSPMIMSIIPTIIYKSSREFISIMLSIPLIYLIAFVGSKQYYSKILVHIGSVSYELFLLHGPFLIKYDPIIGRATGSLLLLEIVAFLLMIISMAFFFRQALKIFYDD